MQNTQSKWVEIISKEVIVITPEENAEMQKLVTEIQQSDLTHITIEHLTLIQEFIKDVVGNHFIYTSKSGDSTMNYTTLAYNPVLKEADSLKDTGIKPIIALVDFLETLHAKYKEKFETHNLTQ
jgi:hypothetical protein